MNGLASPRLAATAWKPLPLQRSRVIPNIVSALEAGGKDADAILGKAGIDRASLDDPDFRVRLDRLLLLFELAGEALDDPALGLKIGTPWGPPFLKYEAARR